MKCTTSHSPISSPFLQRIPFSQGYVEYCRVVGPGVVVGMGYRTQDDAPGQSIGSSLNPLFFVLVKSRSESLL